MSRYKFIVIVLLLGVITASQSISQDRNKNGKERMETVKKMKLLEILDLTDKEADDFLIKFTNAEKLIQEKGAKLRDANKDLVDYLDANSNGSELSKKSNLVVEAQKEFHSAIENRNSVMKQTLSEQNFAKYLAFENAFNRKVRNFKPEGHKGPDGEKMKGKRGNHDRYKGKKNK